ncbi:GDP-L-fucose synthase [Saccharospirillum sp. HFRX-1]|uniref:GDP-L-fucose synthase family protein n=1 Tax=unclassified Saccharospirillum TaxID=2633430 RepID=UPI00371A760C
MKILLTGGSGMVGNNFLEYSKALDAEVFSPSSKELDLLNYTEVNDYITYYKPECVIHAAGTVGGIQANISNPVKFLYNNMEMGFNVIKAAETNKINKLINLGSSCMYPKYAKNPLNEEQILTGALEPTNEGYAIAKIACAKLCEYIDNEDRELFYKTVIPCNLYGRYDSFSKEKSHMIPSVINKLHEAKIKSMPSVDIWGDGSARREFMYAGDLADFLMMAIERIEHVPQYLNVGLGEDYSVNEYYEAIANVVGFKGKFEHDLEKPTGMKQKLVDIAKLNKFGWQAKTSLLEGLKKTYEFYLNGK